MRNWNETIRNLINREMKHSATVKGKTVFADTEEELKEKIAALSSNGKKPDSDSDN